MARGKGSGKRSTRSRQMREWQSATHTQEGWRTVRYAVTSAFQGDPVAAMSFVAVVGGAAFRLAGAVARTATKPVVRVAAEPFEEAGLGLYALAGVAEGGHAIADIITAIRGQPRPEVAYDVSDAPHSEAVSLSTTNGGGLPFLPGVASGGKPPVK